MKILMDGLFVMKWFGEKLQAEKVRSWNVKTSRIVLRAFPHSFSRSNYARCSHRFVSSIPSKKPLRFAQPRPSRNATVIILLVASSYFEMVFPILLRFLEISVRCWPWLGFDETKQEKMDRERSTATRMVR